MGRRRKKRGEPGPYVEHRPGFPTVYIIKYTWPSGKVRYRTEASTTADRDDAHCYTRKEANSILEWWCHCPEIWGITAVKEKI